MKIVLIGSHGMAGHMIYSLLQQHPRFEIITIARNSSPVQPNYELDVKDFDKLRNILSAELPDVVINCIGILNQDAENNPDKAILINSYLPHYLARCANELNFKFIHISTDCVFDGKVGNYIESSTKTGTGYYAMTKALGEVEYGNNLTIRTSIIGPELKANGIGLFHWFMKQEGTIKGYDKAFWSGVTTLQLARSILDFLENGMPTGLINLTNSVKISKYELLMILNKVFRDNKLDIRRVNDYEVDKSLVHTRTDIIIDIPGYLEMAEDLRHWMLNKKREYSQYAVKG